VRRYFEARFESAPGRLAQLVHPDVEVVMPNGEAVRGIDELADFWREQPAYDHLRMEPQLAAVEEMPDGRVLAVIDHVFRWHESGEVANVVHRASIFEVEDGKVRRAVMYLSPEAAREAVHA
jgi:ketosteroid isomerase-like protein